MRRIYVSLTSALYDLHRGVVTVDDIVAVVSNTNYSDYQFAVNCIGAYAHEKPEERISKVQYLEEIWDKLIQPRKMFEGQRICGCATHYSGDRYYDVPTDVQLPRVIDCIRFAYESIWSNNGWVWDSMWRHTKKEHQEKVRAFLAAYPSP